MKHRFLSEILQFVEENKVPVPFFKKYLAERINIYKPQEDGTMTLPEYSNFNTPPVKSEVWNDDNDGFLSNIMYDLVLKVKSPKIVECLIHKSIGWAVITCNGPKDSVEEISLTVHPDLTEVIFASRMLNGVFDAKFDKLKQSLYESIPLNINIDHSCGDVKVSKNPSAKTTSTYSMVVSSEEGEGVYLVKCKKHGSIKIIFN